MSKNETQKIIQEIEKKYKLEMSADGNGNAIIDIYYGGYPVKYLFPSPKFERFLKDQVGLKSKHMRSGVIRYLLNDLQYSNEQVFHRIAIDEDCRDICVDLRDNQNYVNIDEKGWRLVRVPAFKFSRNSELGILPEPDQIKLEQFILLFNRVFPFGHKRNLLLLAFLVRCLIRNFGENPILLILGPKRCGKSTQCEKVKQLINPTKIMRVLSPETTSDLAAKANSSYLPIYDDCDHFSRNIVKALCQMSSGGGHSSRQFFSQGIDVSFSLNQPFIINAVESPTQDASFLNRSIIISMQEIKENSHYSSFEGAKEFRDNLPKLLGGLYEVTSKCLIALPNTRKSDLPPMTEFARICLALESIKPLKASGLLETYKDNQKSEEFRLFLSNRYFSLIHAALSDTKNPNRVIHGRTKIVIKRLKKFRNKDLIYSKLNNPKTFNEYLRANESVLKAHGIDIELKESNMGVKVTLKLEGGESGESDGDLL